MSFSNYKEEEENVITKKLHELATQGCSEMSRGMDSTSTHEEIVEMYEKIPEKERTGEQTRCAVAALILFKEMDYARLLLDKWQNIGKDDVQWNLQYGWTYYLEQNYKETIPYLDRVEDLSPRDTTMLTYLQECNEQVGNKEEVKRLKSRIREINNYGRSRENFKKENYYNK